MKYIKLTQNKRAKVDDVDFEMLHHFTWCVAKDKKRGTFYAVTNRIGTERMARVIIGAKTGEVVDHINHDTLDNRRVNLRICSKLENSRNRKIDKRNTTGYKGVSKCTGLCRHYSKDYFQAQIRVNGKLLTLGHGTNKKKLAKLYNLSAIKFFGKFAHINNLI